MTTLYVAKRRGEKRPQSRVTFMHHVAWGVVCLILLSVMAGLWAQSQTLAAQNKQLRSQIVVQNVAPTTCKVDASWKPNASKTLTMNTKDGPRNYLVHMPDGFVHNQYYPLVMFYPGKGGGAQGSGITYGIYSLPAITVFPFPTTGTDGYTAWEGAPYSSGADDVAFTAAILDKLQSDLCIDRTHMYATGFSNGGAFASLLSCELPGRFAAYGVGSGALYQPHGDCKPPQSSPLINIHGDNDPIVPYNGSAIRHLPEMNEWISMRASIEQCGSPVTTYPEPSTVITTWDKCRGGGVVENVRIVGGGHDWGQLPNPALWQFLSRFSL
jgi:polyhydroxybutyrate depolymerase